MFLITIWASTFLFCLISFIWLNYLDGQVLNVKLLSEFAAVSILPIANVAATLTMYYLIFVESNHNILLKGRKSK